MLGFSLGKLLILVALLLIGWYGLRYIGLMDAARKQKRKFARDAAEMMTEDDKSSPIDTEFDEKTGTYVPRKDSSKKH
jgi:hypothetical protein